MNDQEPLQQFLEDFKAQFQEENSEALRKLMQNMNHKNNNLTEIEK